MANQAFVDKLVSVWPPAQWRDVTIVLAVSGGADSVSLLRAIHGLAESGTRRVVAAHFNHGLRGQESDLDQQFVADLCAKLDVPCVVERADPAVFGRLHAAGIESAARKARYQFLRAVAQRCGARFVATAHTAEDQAETILHRIVRGTGLRGLGGIPRVRPLLAGVTLIRPLLAFRRSQIVAYLQSLDQDFREDSSNQDRRFTRNRIRRELLPRLAADYNQDVVGALIRLARLAGEVQSVVDGLAAELAEHCLVRDDEQSVDLNCGPLREAGALIVREVFVRIWRQHRWPLRDMGFEQWAELAALALASSPQRTCKVFPGAVLAERNGGSLCLRGASADS